MRPYLFLDTEWANDVTRELVSLALTNSDGSLRFYAERNPLPSVPSTFVSKVVFPLLERGTTALSDAEFGIALQAYLRQFKDPLILFDAPLDKKLLKRAINGFGQLKAEMPDLEMALVTRLDVLDRLDEYFITHSEVRARRHHSAVDAEALRWAYMGLVGQDL